MKKNDEEPFRDIRGEVDSGVSAVGDRPEAETGSLCVFNDSRLHQGRSGNKDRESSDILRVYLPQAAILAVGEIYEEPAALDGKIEIRSF